MKYGSDELTLASNKKRQFCSNFWSNELALVSNKKRQLCSKEICISHNFFGFAIYEILEPDANLLSSSPPHAKVDTHSGLEISAKNLQTK